MGGALIVMLIGVESTSLNIAAGADQPPPEATRPLVVFVHAADCKVCAQVRPLIENIEKEYKDKASFVQLDVTTNQKKNEARKTAKSLGVSFFLSFYEDNFPAFGVFKVRKKCQTELYGLHKTEEYKAAIDKALSVK